MRRPIGGDLVALAAWVAEYYCAPLGEVMRLMLPAGGAARVKRTLALTDEGERAATGLSAALEPMALQGLDGEARALLGAIARRGEAGGKGEPPPKALRALVERSLVTVEEAVSTRGARTDTHRARGGAARRGEARAAAFGRAKKRGELYDRIAAGGDDCAVGAAPGRRARRRARARARRGRGSSPPRRASWPSIRSPTRATEHADAADADAGAGGGAGGHRAASSAARAYAPFLLHGVTGSGKTEVYLRAIAAALALGRRALVLVPEIALTPQLAARFRARFGDRVAVLHSGLSDAARADAWRRIARGEVDIALGARSAVFAPVADLGIVVVDEEHDGSFKQEEGVRYHARDVALLRARARRRGGAARLGHAVARDATSPRARRRARPARAARARHRAAAAARRDRRPASSRAEGVLTDALLARRSHATLAAGEQAILFLNRRGFSTFVAVQGVRRGGALPRTARWRSPTTAATSALLCHYCDFSTRAADDVPGLRQAGDRAAWARHRAARGSCSPCRFPGARIARLDRDTAAGDGPRCGSSTRCRARARSTSSSARRWSPRATTSRA